MDTRPMFWAAITATLCAAAARAQSPATQPVPPDMAAAVHDLSSEDFSQRQHAAARIGELLRQQLKLRAQTQAAIDDLQHELADQIRALGMVTDEEARQRVDGLLATEAALAQWTAQAMAAPADKRPALLDWGLSNKNAPILAKAFSTDPAQRIAGIAALGKLPGPFADWTLARLLAARQSWVRDAAMAAAWDRTPTPEIVNLLWRRAIPPDENADSPDDQPTLKIPFPDHDPIEVPAEDDDSDDQELALLLLRHMHSPLVADHINAVIAQRLKKPTDDDDTSLHRLAETYKLKQAIPLLARDALGDVRGRSEGNHTMATNRTSAIGALCTILALDLETFDLSPSDDNSYAWKTDNDNDARPVLKFFDWWRVHASEYGAKAPDDPPQIDDSDDQDDPFAKRELGPPPPDELERETQAHAKGPHIHMGLK
ncbi:MAG TPA: hypothetical protein VH253_02120 [Phycisphaerae bacterium]|nr:hypothetical protein [Phycisphaerae bacterium]